MKKTPKPKRQWLRFMLVPILLLGIWIAWDVGKMKLRLRKQQEAVVVVKDLGGTQVTDAGLEHLTGLIQLEIASFQHTKVTSNATEKLKAALPRKWPERLIVN